MVINGRTISSDECAFAKFDGERIYLPSRFAEQARLTGAKQIECLLVAVTAGRYRLVNPPPGTAKGDLSRILEQWDQAGADGDVLEGTNRNAQAAIRARLLPCFASPPPPGWRINVPKVAMELAPGDRSGVFLQIGAGYVDLWFPDALRQAVSVPISELLS